MVAKKVLYSFYKNNVQIMCVARQFIKPHCVHISNIYEREEFRQKSLISGVVNGIICGLGTNGYILAINAMQELLKDVNR